ncbi:hypothetical protein QA612_21340 [Evansella sp. AB-P1]|uniref:hypothetical protein n=1 Tax=Evansella sp. AB-P1 TaxID=3037653 RepID=UPI00241FE356|nr:hypothetical protein [Evansella sp. AB-P1]MDG5790005.1 hypothetical protein [Evansella sp. AB-P1]
MKAYKDGVKLLCYLTGGYGLVTVLFLYNGFVGWAFYSDLQEMEGVGNVPFAIGVSLVFIWLLFGAVYLFNKNFNIKSKNINDKVKDLVAVTIEKGSLSSSTETQPSPYQFNNLSMKNLLYMLGTFIFGGLMLASFIDANHYLEKYSLYTLWEFRICILLFTGIYFVIVYLFHQKDSNNS